MGAAGGPEARTVGRNPRPGADVYTVQVRAGLVANHLSWPVAWAQRLERIKGNRPNLLTTHRIECIIRP